jgi:type II secretory pathway pseudopilin PulG
MAVQRDAAPAPRCVILIALAIALLLAALLAFVPATSSTLAILDAQAKALTVNAAILANRAAYHRAATDVSSLAWCKAGNQAWYRRCDSSNATGAMPYSLCRRSPRSEPLTHSDHQPVSGWETAYGWFLPGFRDPAFTRQAATRRSLANASRQFAYSERRRGTRNPVTAVVHFDNICVSSVGEGLYGHEVRGGDGQRSSSGMTAVPPRPGLARFDGFEDERRAPFNGEIYVRDVHELASQPPRQLWIDREHPLLIHPVASQSDNLGHVMYRVAALRRLQREMRKKEPAYANATVLFLITGPGRSSWIPPGNKYAVFAELLGVADWIAAFTPGSLAVDGSVPRDGMMSPHRTAPDVCFEKAVVGWEAVHMYSGRYAHQRIVQQRVTIPELRALRQALLSCHHMPRTGKQSPLNVRWITIIHRSRRRFTNVDTIAAAAASAVSRDTAGTSWSVRIVDFSSLTAKEQVEVAATSSVLLGLHGTALQWGLVMPANSSLVEVQYSGYACAPPGVNHPDRRMCEYGPAAMAATVTHIVHRVANETVTCAPSDTSRQFCDVEMSVGEVSRVVGVALCAVREGYALASDKCVE